MIFQIGKFGDFNIGFLVIIAGFVDQIFFETFEPMLFQSRKFDQSVVYAVGRVAKLKSSKILENLRKS